MLACLMVIDITKFINSHGKDLSKVHYHIHHIHNIIYIIIVHCLIDDGGGMEKANDVLPAYKIDSVPKGIVYCAQ